MGNETSGRQGQREGFPGDGKADEPGRTAASYRRFAEVEVGERSPVYRRWADSVADDPQACALIATLPQHKRQPNLVLAAARFVGADVEADLPLWLIANWAAVQPVVLARHTQTNESARTASLLPILATFEGPLSLIEVGASAGLCLYPDQYSYRYVGPDRFVRGSLDPATGPSPVTLTCQVNEATPIPTRLPEVVQRAGVDINPLDIASDDDVAWLETLVWPGQADRLNRLRAAAEIARAEPPHIVRSDLNDTVAALVEQAPADTTVVVFHSAVLPYLEPDDRARFVDTVTDLPCRWIANEGQSSSPNRDSAQAPRGVFGRSEFVVSLDGEPVALTDAHGAWLEWA